ncbi:MAG: hypothetical protein A3G85_09315 [Elusimicrobia bacterium RIFCSPLOWO2_12_FULL_39_28]|nr:MAG: hypothetical protein A3G85_09315 [Elusimicrobia bacterium RIFCSPLOWO2_12_FULL_39_28]
MGAQEIELNQQKPSWKARMGLVLSISKGNSESQFIQTDFLLNRNRQWMDEWTAQGSLVQEHSNQRSVAQKAGIVLRYGRSINRKLYHFFRLGVDHDYFENIQARFLPGTGGGFWFLNNKKHKLMTEAGIAYQRELLRVGPNTNHPIFHARASYETHLSESSNFGFDFHAFPAMDDLERFRLELESYLMAKINKYLSLKLKIQDYYRSKISNDVKKYDFRVYSGIEINL